MSIEKYEAINPNFERILAKVTPEATNVFVDFLEKKNMLDQAL